MCLAIRKLRKLGDSECPSAGVTLQKDVLREDGTIDELNELGEQYAKIEKTGEGLYRVELVNV